MARGLKDWTQGGIKSCCLSYATSETGPTTGPSILILGGIFLRGPGTNTPAMVPPTSGLLCHVPSTPSWVCVFRAIDKGSGPGRRMTSVTTSAQMWDNQHLYFLCDFRGIERRPGLRNRPELQLAKPSQGVLWGECKQVTLKQPQPFAGGAWPWWEMQTNRVLGEGRSHLALALLLLLLAANKTNCRTAQWQRVVFWS